ncbi:MAG: hypothetical protein R3D45_15955 [Rhizobiaceae bacterium]
MTGAFIAYLSVSLTDTLNSFRLIENKNGTIVNSRTRKRIRFKAEKNPKEWKMSLFSFLRSSPEERRIARENARTYRLINSLPEEIRKDIGWPDGRQIRRLRAGTGQ